MSATIAAPSVHLFTADVPAPSRPRRWVAPTLVGVVVVLVASVGIGTPSLWFDEAASVSAATRPPADLDALVGHVDEVHALYYRLLHAWFSVVGYTPFTLRLPSAAGVAAASALLVVLGRLLFSARVGVVAGLVAGLGPCLGGMAVEGRSYALATAAGVGLTIVLVQAVRAAPRSRRLGTAWWSAYAVLTVVSTHLFLYSLLLPVAHAAVLVWWTVRAQRRRPGRAVESGLRALVGFGLASAIAVVSLVPFVTTALSQSGQVSWIPDPLPTIVQSALVSQWFPSSPVVALVCWPLALLGVAALARRRDSTAPRRGLVLLVAWLAIPPALLVGVSLVHDPIYLARYVGPTEPALALLIAAGIDALLRSARLRHRTAAGVTAGALALGAGLVALGQQRVPEGSGNVSWSAAAARLDALHATGAVVFGELPLHQASAGPLAVAYPGAFRSLDDVLVTATAVEAESLWPERMPLADGIDRLTAFDDVWFVARDDRRATDRAVTTIREAGFTVASRDAVGGFDLVHLSR